MLNALAILPSFMPLLNIPKMMFFWSSVISARFFFDIIIKGRISGADKLIDCAVFDKSTKIGTDVL